MTGFTGKTSCLLISAQLFVSASTFAVVDDYVADHILKQPNSKSYYKLFRELIDNQVKGHNRKLPDFNKFWSKKDIWTRGYCYQREEAKSGKYANTVFDTWHVTWKKLVRVPGPVPIYPGYRYGGGYYRYPPRSYVYTNKFFVMNYIHHEWYDPIDLKREPGFTFDKGVRVGFGADSGLKSWDWWSNNMDSNYSAPADNKDFYFVTNRQIVQPYVPYTDYIGYPKGYPLKSNHQYMIIAQYRDYLIARQLFPNHEPGFRGRWEDPQ